MATTFNKTWAKAKKWQYFVIQKAKLYKIGDANMTFYAWKQFNKGAQSVVADQVECAGADFDLFIDDGGDDTWTLDDLINYFPLGNGDNSPTPLEGFGRIFKKEKIPREEMYQFAVNKRNKLKSNAIVFGYIRGCSGKGVDVETSNLCLEFYCFQVDKLAIGDTIDHRDEFGKFFPAIIIDQNGNNLKLHYIGCDTKWDRWSDCKLEIDRFTKHKSISRRSEHPNFYFWCDINPRFNKHNGWRFGKIKERDKKSGQARVEYEEYENGRDKTYKLWVHLGDDAEVREESCEHCGDPLIGKRKGHLCMSCFYEEALFQKKMSIMEDNARQKNKKWKKEKMDYAEIPKEWRGGMDLYDL